MERFESLVSPALLLFRYTIIFSSTAWRDSLYFIIKTCLALLVIVLVKIINGDVV